MTAQPPTVEARWKYEPLLRRSLLDRVWAPWNAVRSYTFLDEFLRSRFARYLAQLPQRPTDLGFDVEVRGTEVVRLRDVVLPAQPVHDDAIERELEAARTVELEAQTHLASVTAQVEQEENRLAQAISDGAVHPRGRTSVRASRPAMPPRGPIVMFAGLLIALACCEALMIAFPFWDAVGVDTQRLWSELHVQFVGVAGGAGFAIAAVLALIGASERLRDLWRRVWGLDSACRDRWSSGTLLVAGSVLLGGTVYGLAAVRHGMSAATSAVAAGLQGGASTGGLGAWAFVAVTLLILFASPKATSWLVQQLEDRRRAADTIRAHELEHDQKQMVRERREEALATTRSRVTEATRRRELATVSLRELGGRAAEAARYERELTENEHRHAVAYSRALYAALEADRFAFIRRARRRGRADLIGEAPSPSLALVPLASSSVRIAS